VRLIVNLVWLFFAGIWMFLAYTLAAIVGCLLIITIPFAIAAFRIGLYALWPFGRTVVRDPRAGAASLFGNIVWLLLFGWWLALGHLISGILMCLTIIGIPLGLGSFKLIPVSLTPFGHRIVSLREARALGYGPSL
jgi:uncharacterized membrane protein YccF (DUF307 family)